MRLTLSFLAVVPTIQVVASAVIPAPQHDEQSAYSARTEVVELELNRSQPNVLFRVPCVGCLGDQEQPGDDEAFVFDFQAFPSDEPCGISNVTVNGVAVAEVWNGASASGEGSFRSIPAGSDLPEHQLGLSWESNCLVAKSSKDEPATVEDEPAQLFTVTITSVDGKEIDVKSGFTISFRPVVPIELLRLSVTPDKEASSQQFSEDWRNPPEHLRLNALSAQDTDVLVDEEFAESQTNSDSLRQQIQELRKLEEQRDELTRLIDEKKKKIKCQTTTDAHSLASDLRQCEGLSCVFKAILDGARGAIKVVFYKISPAWQPFSFSDRHGRFMHSGQTNQKVSSVEDATSGNATRAAPTTLTQSLNDPMGSAYSTLNDEKPTYSTLLTPLHIALEAVVALLGLGAIFAFIKTCCCTARQKQDRAATREERRNLRAYRRAARRHKWSRWFHPSRAQDEDRIDDYEEKRALILDQENVLETAMQDEIRMLREAHNVVNSIVHAEEGRGFRSTPVTGMSSFIHPHMSTHPALILRNNNTVIPRPPSRSDTLPGYRSEEGSMSEPPAYETDEDVSDVVPDGFREYTPATSYASTTAEHHIPTQTVGATVIVASGSVAIAPTTGQRQHQPQHHWTPGSSVISTTPRPSMETLESRRFESMYGNRRRCGSCSSSQWGGSETSV